MSSTTNTSTCTKCGRVFAPAGQGNCTLRPADSPLWTTHAGALESLERSMQQCGGKVTPAATETFIAAREDNLSREVQRQSPEPKPKGPANGGGEGEGEMTAADVDRIIAEKQRVVDQALGEIAHLECEVIESDVARGRLSAEEGRDMMEVLRGVNERSKADARMRLEEEKKVLLKKVDKT
ncbi:hypothetical protein BJY00DRAFT_318774 [Aspergillus carlsbadensis]|nr:hypothetical protein BJY00DRAFT_318774 [Aspergillus carlsbadensis]